MSTQVYERLKIDFTYNAISNNYMVFALIDSVLWCLFNFNIFLNLFSESQRLFLKIKNKQIRILSHVDRHKASL